MAKLLVTYKCHVTIETEITDDQLNALLREDEIACVGDIDMLSSVYNLQLLFNTF